MNQKPLYMKNYDTPTEQQADQRGRNVTVRGKKFGSQTQGKSGTFQLDIKMMNFNKKSRRGLPRRDLKFSRGRQSEGEHNSRSHSWSQRHCTGVNTARGNGNQGTAVQEIPGFYYDPEKKKYFKITKDHPGKKFVLCQCGGWKDASGHNHNNIIPSKVAKKPTKVSILYHLQQREYVCPSQVTERHLLERLSRLLKVKQRLSLDPVSGNYIPVDKYAVCKIEPDANHERLLTLYETIPSGSQIVQFHNLSNDRNNNLEILHHMAMIKNQKITGLLWSPHESSKNLYIASLLGYGSMSGETMVFEVNGASQRIVGRCAVHGSTVWTNAWNRNPLFSNIISIGASKVALTVDVNTRRRVIHVRCDSDVFAQEFSRSNPVLYNGSRDGCIRTCDVRVTGSSWPVMCLMQGKLASVTCIRVLHDENYILSSGLDGSLKMWDLRIRACVQNYRGHVNEITHGLPFYLDPSDSLLFAAGQDSVTRIWSVASGELLHSIPFPDSVDRSVGSIPALYYSEEWGGKGGMPGLLYGAGDTIYSYTY